MTGRPRVLGPDSGTSDARCLVLAEAPGLHGAVHTGVPLHGDRTGDTFEQLLVEAGIRREDLFISNAVLCAPVDDDGAGRTPSRSEVARCTHFVGELIECLDPAIVVTLGATALSSTEQLEPHGLMLRWDAGDIKRWFGRFLLPLYHPGPRSTILRPWSRQRQDFALLASLLYQ